MQECVSIGCEAGDQECMTSNSGNCLKECNAGEPEPTDEGGKCMQECTKKGCEDYDWECQNKNHGKCEEECGMKGDAPEESEMDEEQLCISNCVAAEDPSVICGNSKEGETGNTLCQSCAAECVHLYAGPCLNDEQLTEKENVCISKCEHCYGKPIEGPSGQGWDCIIDIECADSSDEFGDEPGEGPGIGQEGFVSKIANFFKGLFGSVEEVSEEIKSISNELETESESKQVIQTG